MIGIDRSEWFLTGPNSISISDDFHPPGDLSNELSTHSSMSRASLQKLKDEIRTCFNESLFYQIEDVNSIIGKSSPDVASFLEIMIRRLKRLASLHT